LAVLATPAVEDAELDLGYLISFEVEPSAASFHGVRSSEPEASFALDAFRAPYDPEADPEAADEVMELRFWTAKDTSERLDVAARGVRSVRAKTTVASYDVAQVVESPFQESSSNRNLYQSTECRPLR